MTFTIRAREGLTGPPVPIGAGLALHLPQRFTVTDTELPNYEIEITIDRLKNGHDVLTASVRVTSETSDVTGTVMRALKLREYVRGGVDVTAEVASGEGWAYGPSITERAHRAMKSHPGDEHERLLWTARISRLAEVSRGTPNQDVATTFGVSARTASRWIAKAREFGFFD